MSNIIASLVAKISADTSGLDTGLAKAKAGLDGVAGSMQSMGGAFPADQLNSEFSQFSSAVNASKGSVGGLISSFMDSGGLVAALGIASIATAGIKKLFDFSEEGAQFQRLQDGFASVANSYGVDSASILDSMRKASNGTINDQDLMLASNRAMLLGVSTDATKLGQITEAAIARGRAMGLSSSEAIDRVFTGIGRLSPKILDDLGIITNATQRYEDYAKAHNVAANSLDDFTKRQIISDAVIADSQKLLSATGGLSDDNASSFERLKASFTNLTNSMKLSSSDTFTPINNILSNYFQGSSQKFDNSKAYEEYLKATSEANPMSMPQFENMQASRSAYSQRMAGQARLYGNAPEAAAPAAPVDYTGVLSNALKLTDVTEKYNEQLNKQAEKLIDAPQKYSLTADQAANLTGKLTDLNSISEGYNLTLMQELDNLTRVDGQYGKNNARIREAREGITALKQASLDATNQMVLGSLQQKNATDEQQLGFARATGMITEQSFQQAMAISKISDALAANKISANQAAEAAKGVANGLASINGFNAVGYVDIFVTYHTSGGGVPGGINSGINSSVVIGASEGGSGINKSGNQVVRRAIGGPVSAGSMYSITEYGEPEVLTSGGKQYLVTGKDGGYVQPAGSGKKSADGMGSDTHLMMAMLSRLGSPEENARALRKELQKYSVI